MISKEHTPLICQLIDAAGTDMAMRSTVTAGEALELILKGGGDRQGAYAYLTLWTLVYAIAGSIAMNLEDIPPKELEGINKFLPALMKEASEVAVRDVALNGLILSTQGFGGLEDILREAGISPSQAQGPLKPKRRWWNIW